MWWSPAGQSGVVVQSILDAAGYFLWDNRRNIFKQFREKFRKDFLGDCWSNFFCKGSEFMSRASEIWSIEFHCGLGWRIRMFARIVTRNLQAFPWTLHWRAPCGCRRSILTTSRSLQRSCSRKSSTRPTPACWRSWYEHQVGGGAEEQQDSQAS